MAEVNPVIIVGIKVIRVLVLAEANRLKHREEGFTPGLALESSDAFMAARAAESVELVTAIS